MNSDLKGCRFCGHIHSDLCPQVKALEYHEDGVTVRRVEFFSPKDHVDPQVLEMARKYAEGQS